MCASCRVLPDGAGHLFQAGTMTTKRKSVNNSSTVVAEETPIDSEPRTNVNRDVEKVFLFPPTSKIALSRKTTESVNVFQMSLVARKLVFGVCDQVRLKPACSSTETI